MKRTPLFLVLLTLALALLPSCTPPGGGADAKPVIYLYPLSLIHISEPTRH